MKSLKNDFKKYKKENKVTEEETALIYYYIEKIMIMFKQPS
jgi:hypothetical protein